MYRLLVLWALCISCNQPSQAQPVRVAEPSQVDAGAGAADADASPSEDACLKKINDRLAEQRQLIEEIGENLDRKKRRRR